MDMNDADGPARPTDAQNLASDNYSGMCPEALEAFLEANSGHLPAYGDDRYTQEAAERFREVFETDCEVFFVYNGTAANSLVLASLTRSYESIVCHEVAHIETDECGAPEFFSNGSKLLLGRGENGKLDPATIEAIARKRADIHYPRPRAVSLTQATELGTVYRHEELAAIRGVADRNRLYVHMDGARFANACAGLGVPPRAITWEAGVDVLCLGGTKNGMAVGEAVIFFNRDLADGFDYRCKQSGQLASKMRFLSAPWLGMLRTGAWLRRAGDANAAAASLVEQVADIPEVRVMFPREANAVFLEMPEPVSAALKQRGWRFYTFIGVGGARLMCSWDTRSETIDAFVDDLKTALVAHRPLRRVQ